MKRLIAFLIVIFSLLPHPLKAKCINNPTQIATDLFSLCWSCIFPLKIAGVTIVPGSMPDSPTSQVNSPICICPAPPPIMIRIGIPVGFYNPDRIIDAVKDPFCFEGLGIAITPPQPNGAGVQADDPNSGKHSFFQAHLVVFPPFELLNILTDFICVQSSGIDIAYMTEVDPMWNDDTLSALIQPEALLFGNPVTNLACMADSIASQGNLPIDPLFWCKGSWGNAYPMTGSVTSGDLVQASASAAAGLIYKLHRQLIMWGQWGYPGLCHKYPLPIWQKTAYRMQIIAPVPNAMATGIGQSGLLWGYAKNIPMKGDNFGYIIFRKKDCCAF